MMTRLLETRRYVAPDEILELDSTLSAGVGSCVLLVRSPICGHSFTVAANLADVARLLWILPSGQKGANR